MRLKYLLRLLLLLPVLSACNQEDDVLDIVTGKNWKLNFIINSKGDNITESYFTSEEVRKASLKKLGQPENFRISFTGVEIESKVIGSYSGRVTNSTISGKWQADGKSNAFSISDQSGPSSGEDVLGKVFVNALINAYKYEGDTNGNLTIYFEDKERKDQRCLVLFNPKQ